MPPVLSFPDIQAFILVKACFFIFIALGILGIYKKWKPSYFLLLVGGLSALAYVFLVRGTALMFWGLEGDEVTIAAMHETFAHATFWGDFAYHHLPPFYPPLWFFVFGLLGRAADLNGIQLAKIAAAVTMAVYPLFFYFMQRWFWRRLPHTTPPLKGEGGGQETPSEISWLLSSLFLFILTDWDATITKPYELISASLAVLWTQYLMVCLWKGTMTVKKVIVFGVTGGILFLLFYFWLFLAAIGIALFNVFYRRVSARQYLTLGAIGGLILLVGAPYWLPLALSYHRFGAENWQLGFLTAEWLKTYGPGLVFSIDGAIALVGLIGLIWFRERICIRVLLALFVAGYVWQMMGMATIYFFASPLQESKGFTFWSYAILALAAGYAGERLWQWWKERYPDQASARTSVLVIGVVVLARELLFGSFADQGNVMNLKSRAQKLHPYMGTLITNVRKKFPDIADKTVFHSGFHELNAFLPINEFVFFNMHNSHPAAGFSERLRFVKELAGSKDVAAFHAAIRENRFAPIDVLIFYTGEPTSYPVYFHVDNFPDRFKEVIVHIPRALLAPSHFDKVYENDSYVVFVPKKL